MFKVAIILLENCYCSSVSAVTDLFQVANAHCRRLPAPREPFSATLMSERGGEAVKAVGGVRLLSDASFDSLEQFDVVYIPGVFYPGASEYEQWLQSQQPLCQRLRYLAEKNIKIAANCTSTFLLAEAGLLDHKFATTTWWLEQQFRHRYPLVNLDTRKAVTVDGNITCSGAMTAGLQFVLRLVEEQTSPEIATLCAKTMLINQGQMEQTPYQELNITVTNDDPVIAKAQYWLRNHMQKDVDFAALASELGVSQRTLIRRFKQAADATPLNYLQNLRIERTKALLAKSPLSVADIMVEVGYSDPSAFNRLFKQRVGLTPSAYRQRFAELA